MCFAKDFITYSEGGNKLKSQWVFLGIHCVKETGLRLVLRFGKVNRRQRSEPRLSSLPDLNEFRRDEGKRQALALKVEELIIQRHAAWALKYSGKDYIRDNRRFMFPAPDADKRETETQRRQAAILKRKQCLREKKAKALLSLRRQELRAEADRLVQVALEAQQQWQSQQRQWLQWVHVSVALETLWGKFHKRKATFEVSKRRMKAAMVLQRCYKKVILTVNPKRLIRQHAMHHLKLYLNIVGNLERRTISISLKTVISASTELHNIRKTMSEFYSKSE